MSYHQLVVAQHHAISTDSPVVILSQVGKNDLHSGGSSVNISCNLVSLNLVVGSHGTDENGHSRSDSIGKVFGLANQRLVLMSFFLLHRRDSKWLGVMTYLIVDGFKAVSTALAVGTGCGEGML